MACAQTDRMQQTNRKSRKGSTVVCFGNSKFATHPNRQGFNYVREKGRILYIMYATYARFLLQMTHAGSHGGPCTDDALLDKIGLFVFVLVGHDLTEPRAIESAVVVTGLAANDGVVNVSDLSLRIIAHTHVLSSRKDHSWYKCFGRQFVQPCDFSDEAI